VIEQKHITSVPFFWQMKRKELKIIVNSWHNQKKLCHVGASNLIGEEADCRL
jgi:hypothetical protein